MINTYNFDSNALNYLDRLDLLKPLLKRELTNDILSKVDIEQEKIESLILQIKQKNRIETDKEFKNWLKKINSSEKTLRDEISRPMKIEKYSRENFSLGLNNHYLKRKSELDQVVYTLLRIKDPFKAKEIYFRIKDNEEHISDLAKKYSEGLERRTNGIVGPVPIKKGHPELENILRSMKPGELQGPINVANWWLIIKLESHIEAILDKDLEKILLAELFNNWLESETTNKLKLIKNNISN